MAEIAPADLPADVLARFDPEDDHAAAQAAIDASLAAVRRYCGWHVSPVIEDAVVTVEDVAANLLGLPTLKLVELTSIEENGEVVDPDGLSWSIPGEGQSRRGLVTKNHGHWASKYGAISVTMTHGFSETEALDWRAAIIDLVDLWSQTPDRDTADLKRKKVRDVEAEWFEGAVSTNDELAAKFSQFRILPSP